MVPSGNVNPIMGCPGIHKNDTKYVDLDSKGLD